MPMESEKLAEEHQKKELTAHSYSLVTAVLALVMIIVGSVYWAEEDCKWVNFNKQALYIKHSLSIFSHQALSQGWEPPRISTMAACSV